MICGNCGKHTSYWLDKCGYCGKPFHVKDCDKQPGSCKCHEINKDIYEKDHPTSIEVKKVESKIKQSTKKTSNDTN